ncbi:MAG: hypothetical protein GY758_04080, partial [Fuerstiella sp.]|nr:hypothetical protein [Fuerstiella sp.]
MLPVNVYPATPSVNSEMPDGKLPKRPKTVVSETLPEKKEPLSEAASPKKQQQESSNSSAAKLETEADHGVVAESPERVSLPRLQLRRVIPKGAVFTPFRMLMLAIISVVCLTGYWVASQRHVEVAQQTWLKASDSIDQLMAEGDFITLEKTLAETITAG